VALNELQSLVDDLAQRTRAPTVLEDPEQRMVVYSCQDGPIDKVRRDSILMRETPPEVMRWFRQFGIVDANAPLRIPSHPELGILGRLCVPVRFRGRLMGFLFLMDDEQRLAGPDSALVEQAGMHAGLLLYEEELAQRLSASVFSHLLAPEAEMRGAAARQLVGEGMAAADAPHVAICIRPANPEVPALPEMIGEALCEVFRRRGQTGLLQLARPDHGLLLVPVASGSDDRRAAVVAEEARAELARRLRDGTGRRCHGSPRVIAGLGDPQLRLTEASLSCRQALLAARVATAVPSVGDLARWRDLGAFRVLVQVSPGEDDQGSSLDPRLVRLLSADDGLAQTVETYLDLGGDAKRTAEQLQLHRSTLYYRLAKAAKVTGADLHDGNDRLALHLGFKLARLNGGYPTQGQG
jgi:hypothetical protein